jgi:hypothetical protein
MTWAKVCDSLHLHRKLRKAGPAAMGLWVAALSFCADQLTDGVVELEDAEGLAQRLGVPLAEIPAWVPEHAARLVKAGLWEVRGGGWIFHDWCDLQPSRADVLAKREQGTTAARKRWGGSGSAPSSAPRNAVGTAAPNTRPEPRPEQRPISPGSFVPADLEPADAEPTAGSTERDGSPGSPSPADPWGLTPDGKDPDELPPPPPAEEQQGPPARGRPDAGWLTLSPYERQIADAIKRDETLAPIVPRPNATAADLARAAPAVDIVRKVAALGAWLRANPARKKKNGAAFLLRCIGKDQEAGGTRGWMAPSSAPAVEPPATPPPRSEVLEAVADPGKSLEDVIARIGTPKAGGSR